MSIFFRYSYMARTWSVTEASSQRLDAFDQWCLRRILRVPYTAHVTNVSVRSQTNQPSFSSLMQQRRLKLFGHIARAAASKDHSRALRASTERLPVDWRRPRGRPRQSWLRERSQTTQTWTSLCITASNGSSCLAMHRGNGYALRACHLMMIIKTARVLVQSRNCPLPGPFPWAVSKSTGF